MASEQPTVIYKLYLDKRPKEQGLANIERIVNFDWDVSTDAEMVDISMVLQSNLERIVETADVELGIF